MAGAGWSAASISQEIGTSKRTVERWMRRYSETGGTDALPRPGRPRCTSSDLDRKIVALAEEPVERTAVEIHASLDPEEAPTVRTVQYRLNEAGLRSRVKRLRELALSKPAVQAKRLEWVLQVNRFWEAWQDKTVYVDESRFESTVGHRTRVWVRPTPGRRVNQWVMRSGRISVCVWGGMIGDALTPLHIVNGKFNSAQYVTVLRDVVEPWLRRTFGPQDTYIYLQDNSPVHRGRAVQEYLESVPDLRDSIMFLPPYSPDLNPIEHVWARMKRELRGGVYRTRPELIRAVEEAWMKVGRDREFLQRLTSSMPRRLAAVEEEMGGPTRY